MRINKISHIFYLTADYTETENEISALSRVKKKRLPLVMNQIFKVRIWKNQV